MSIISKKTISWFLSGAIALSLLVSPIANVSAESLQVNNYQLDNRIRLNSIGFLPDQVKKATTCKR